jgi:TetR/AcrR family transcriptional regulator, cholesterol catabolism regulator
MAKRDTGTGAAAPASAARPKSRNRPVDQARRGDLLNAAERVFQRRSYAGATMQEIADEFGVLKGSLYHYVRSKEELLLEVEERAHETILRRTESAMAGADSDLARIWLFIYSIVRANAENPAMGALAKAALELPPGAARRRIIRERAKFDALLLRLLKAAQAAGAIQSDVDPQVIAYGILGLSNSVYIWYNPGGRVSATELARTMADLLVSGLLPDSRIDSSKWG